MVQAHLTQWNCLALRKGTREAAQKALPPEVFDDHDIGNVVSYQALSPSYRVFVASLQTVSMPKDWKAAKQDPKWRESMIDELEVPKKQDMGVNHIAGRKESSEL